MRLACFVALCAMVIAACTRIVDLTPLPDASIIDSRVPLDGGPLPDGILTDAFQLGDAFHPD
jgi:hypothetical protein